MLINLINSKIHDAGKISFNKQECEIWRTNRGAGLSCCKDSWTVKMREKVLGTDRDAGRGWERVETILWLFLFSEGNGISQGNRIPKSPCSFHKSILYPKSSNSKNIKVSFVHFYIFSKILVLKIQIIIMNTRDHFMAYQGPPHILACLIVSKALPHKRKWWTRIPIPDFWLPSPGSFLLNSNLLSFLSPGYWIQTCYLLQRSAPICGYGHILQYSKPREGCRLPIPNAQSRDSMLNKWINKTISH